MRSPVLFLIFNRPDTTERVFEEIRKAQPPRLYIAADGSRADRPGEKELCEKTRTVYRKIDWDCEVKTLFREENLGCGRAVSQAITWFFDNEPEGIILEDDILPHPDFFPYCDELLDRYRDNEEIQLITGRNNFFNGYNNIYSYYMSSYFHIWGWASWRRVWNTYEFDASRLSKDGFMQKISQRLPKKGISYWSDIFDMMLLHKCNTWDYQLYFNQILNDRYTIIPYSNLTQNIGFGNNATHTGKSDIRQVLHQRNKILPLNHPNGVMEDKLADIIHMENMWLYKQNILSRICRRLNRFIIRK
ncbi:glycosyltransferase family 2 protein [Muribaculum intestinale]|uniref:glycosyltransferase family 2 protein n=1 Tax=Muribaculum intestinale TaxID=1796646 RepID=UPI002625FAA0|nr:nucleotide-diphospho-sugar transferase [Muribaculum intestinale]